jgi:hypothetical protein
MTDFNKQYSRQNPLKYESKSMDYHLPEWIANLKNYFTKYSKTDYLPPNNADFA